MPKTSIIFLPEFFISGSEWPDTVSHVPGKLLTTADTLSRAPSPQCDTQLQEETDWFVETVAAALPASDHHLKQYKKMLKIMIQHMQQLSNCF